MISLLLLALKVAAGVMQCCWWQGLSWAHESDATLFTLLVAGIQRVFKSQRIHIIAKGAQVFIDL